MCLQSTPFGTTMHQREIAVTTKMLQDFLAMTFQKLRRANIVASPRGAVRGYALAHHPNAIK